MCRRKMLRLAKRFSFATEEPLPGTHRERTRRVFRRYETYRCRASETRRAMETRISWKRSLRGVSVGARPLVGTDATRDRRCRWDRSLCCFPPPSLSPTLSLFLSFSALTRARYENELLAHCTRTRSESTGTRYRGRSRFPFEISFSARIRYRHRISVGREGDARSSFTRGLVARRDAAPRTVSLLRGSRPSDSLLRGYFYLNASTPSPSPCFLTSADRAK